MLRNSFAIKKREFKKRNSPLREMYIVPLTDVLNWLNVQAKSSQLCLTSMRKSPILRPALQATPPSSTDSRYCSAGNAGVGVNSSIGV